MDTIIVKVFKFFLSLRFSYIKLFIFTFKIGPFNIRLIRYYLSFVIDKLRNSVPISFILSVQTSNYDNKTRFLRFFCIKKRIKEIAFNFRT